MSSVRSAANCAYLGIYSLLLRTVLNTIFAMLLVIAIEKMFFCYCRAFKFLVCASVAVGLLNNINICQ